MLTDFEARLADVLGARLAAPFGGRVRRRGAAAPTGSGPVVRVGIDAFEPLDPDFGSVRPEIVPGADDLRRVLRLRVMVGIDVQPRNAGNRFDELAGVDHLVYELQHPDMRSAALLVAPGDQGFVLDHLHLQPSKLNGDADLVVRAEGWFWPVGEVGEAGRAIERALVREFRLPMRLRPAAAPVAGGPAVALDVLFGATGTLTLSADDAAVAPFGAIAVRLTDAGGGTGAGTLAGGADGPGGARLVSVVDGTAALNYAPPATAGVDHLVVSSFTRDDADEERIGIELARFELAVAP